jgi:hypothetical protein
VGGAVAGPARGSRLRIADRQPSDQVVYFASAKRGSPLLPLMRAHLIVRSTGAIAESAEPHGWRAPTLVAECATKSRRRSAPLHWPEVGCMSASCVFRRPRAGSTQPSPHSRRSTIALPDYNRRGAHCRPWKRATLTSFACRGLLGQRLNRTTTCFMPNSCPILRATAVTHGYSRSAFFFACKETA